MPTKKPLTKRQFHIWRCIARGLSNKEIARKLGYSIPVVESDTRQLYKQLQVKNRTQAAMSYVFNPQSR